jgi:hypothetical protein
MEWQKARQSVTKGNMEMDGAPENSRQAITLSNSKQEAQAPEARVTGKGGTRAGSKKLQRLQLRIRQTEQT